MSVLHLEALIWILPQAEVVSKQHAGMFSGDVTTIISAQVAAKHFP